MADNEEDKKPFDRFELFTALLLGLAAIGAAVAGQQGGQWGGKQLEAFSSANTLTTKAATQYNEDTVNINADYAAVASAKDHILQARDSEGRDRERHLDMASYQYTNQMTELGYKAMGLPMSYYIEDEDETSGEPAKPAAAQAQPAASPEGDAAEEAADKEEDPQAAAETALVRDIPDETLFASLKTELDDEYIDKALEKGTKMFADADKQFEEGRKANDNGDKFDLAVVYFTVSLFFAGLGLVLKTRARWGFFGFGLFVFAATAIYMMTLPWA
jgi:hypothetical protein